jgi:hypothetical protein
MFTTSRPYPIRISEALLAMSSLPGRLPGVIRSTCVLSAAFGTLAMASGCAGGAGVVDGAFESLPRIDVEEVARIEANNGAGILAEVSGLVADPREGLVYLVVAGSRTVPALDWRGEVRFELGGPDDPDAVFSRPEEITRAGDSIWVYDRVRYQLTHFVGRQVVGRVTYSSFETPGDAFSWVTVRPLPDGNGIGVPLVPPDMDGGRADVVHPVVRVTPEGEVVDTLWTQRVGNVDVEVLWFGGGGGSAGPQPFSPDPVRALSWVDESVVTVSHTTGDRAVIVVEKVLLSGDEQFRVELPFYPEPITDAEVDAAVELMSTGWDGRVETEGEIRALFREALVVPEVRRPYQAVLAADDGRVWIRLTPGTERGGLGPIPPHAAGVGPELLGGDAEGSGWLVLSAEGEVEGRTEFPGGFVPMWVDGESVVGVETDDLENRHVVRFAWTRPEAP